MSNGSINPDAIGKDEKDLCTIVKLFKSLALKCMLI